MRGQRLVLGFVGIDTSLLAIRYDGCTKTLSEWKAFQIFHLYISVNMLERPMSTTSPPTVKRHSSLSMSANSKAMVSILEDKEAISRSSHDIDVDMCVWMARI